MSRYCPDCGTRGKYIEDKGDLLGGMAKGGAMGAAIGSFIPFIGTAVGGAVGSVLGGINGSGSDTKMKCPECGKTWNNND
ncbi:hypothetical protein [Lonepinella sp. MS14435]|uniref:hypothetical protein n=1 Tax=Lonepinella sp. MS14435 TaxID=3003618 RepID=UPI0036DB6878